MTVDTIVRARISSKVKKDAAHVLDQMGLSVSDAIRMMLIRVSREKALPFEVKVPNGTTLAAMAELESRKGKRAANVKKLMAALNEDD